MVVGLISGIVCVSCTGLWGGGVTLMNGLTVGKLEVGNGRHYLLICQRILEFCGCLQHRHT